MAGPAASVPTPKAETLVAHFWRQVSTREHEPAMYLRAGGRYAPIAWGQMGAAATRLAAFLLDVGVTQQEHVGIWSNNRPEWHIADCAVLSLGCRPVPVYLTSSPEQVAYVLGHCEATVLVVENQKLLEAVVALRPQLPALRCCIVIAGVDDASDDGFIVPWTAALEAGTSALEIQQQELDRRIAGITLDDVATLIYTSGTTGPPKAVQLTHANIASAIQSAAPILDARSDDRILSYLPLAHIAERMVSEFRSYVYGNPTYFLDGLEHLPDRLREVRPSVFFGVPRIWEKMAQRVRSGIDGAPFVRRRVAQWALDVGRRAEEAGSGQRRLGFVLAREQRLADRLVLGKLRTAIGLDRARILISGAAPLGPDVLRFFRAIGLEICEVYGQTEDCGLTTTNRPGLSKVGTVGSQVPGVEVRLAGDGEILVRGGNVFSAYYRDESATREALVDGWLHTGDVGRFDGEGFLCITDRKKDLIITAGGKNISPTNIESLLKLNGLISNAVVIGDRRPFITALLTLDPDEARHAAAQSVPPLSLEALAEDADLQAAVRRHVGSVNQHLSHVEQIKRWTILGCDFTMGDELTPTLKVKRKVVVEKYAGVIDAMYSGRDT